MPRVLIDLQRPPSSFFKYQGAKFLTRQNHDYMKAMTASWMSRFSAKDFGHLGKKIPARSLSLFLSFSLLPPLLTTNALHGYCVSQTKMKEQAELARNTARRR